MAKKDNKKKVELEFRIDSIEVIRMSHEPFLADPLSFKPELFSFNTVINTRVSKKDKILASLVSIKIVNGLGDLDKLPILFSMDMSCTFYIENIEIALPSNTKGETEIPHEIENHFARITYGTARGIVYAYLKGTPLHKAVLPVIDIK